MATSPLSDSPSQVGGTPRGDAGKFIEYGQFIDTTLRRTRRQVRNVDIAGGVMVLGAGTLAFFLLTAVLDHWVMAGGLGTISRWAALLIFIAGSATYLWRHLLPLVLRRINPVYAAHSIERAKPTLKNSLVNFLLFRANPAGLTQNVFEAIEEQAATNLAKVPVEATVDRSKLIKIGYVFLTVLLVAALYKVISPKDPLRTVGRVVLPWADLDPPTRVRILGVKPENATVFRGLQVPIAAEVQGLASGQPVTLYYSTADGQLADRAVVMQVPAGGYVYECDLPDGKGGVQQDLTYRIVAGDAVTHTFRLEVQAAPTIVVESVDYRYPDYTGMVNQSIDHQADIKGIEGTQVTIRAEANQPIKKAALDLDCNGTDDQRMTFDDRKAWVTFTLALQDDRKTPEHTSYQLKFINNEGQENVQPIRHQIEVTPDVPPEIQFLAPNKDNVEVPLNAALPCEITANDPDYALGKVTLVGSFEGRALLEKTLLDETWRGQFIKKFSLTPMQLGLKAGDVFEYWAWAEDNKSPAASRTETPHRRLKVISPTRQQPDQHQLAHNDKADPLNRDGERNAQPPQDNEQNHDRAANQDQEKQDQQKQDGQDQQGDAGGQDGESKQQGKEKQQGQGGKGDSGEGQNAAAEQGSEPQGAQQGEPKNERDKSGQPNADKGNSGNGSQEPSDEPVAKDGSQDGEAFEKIMDRQREREPDKLKPNDDKSAGNNQPGGDQKQIQGDQSGGGKPQAAGREEKPTENQGGGEKGPQGKQNSQGEGGNDSGLKAPPGAKGSPAGTKPGGSGKGEEENDQPGKPTGEPGGKTGGKPEAGEGPDDRSGGEQTQQGDPAGAGKDLKAGQAPAGKQPPDKKPEAGKSNEDTGEETRAGAKAENKSGQGDRSKGSTQQNSKAKPSGERQQPAAKGGDEEHDKGQSGAGQKSPNDKRGSPPAQGNNRQRDKTPSFDKSSDQQPGAEPPSPSISERQSDSKGDQSGDRSGGGKRGGGQKANKPGTGGAGQNTAADEGGGAANERSDGDTSDRPGEDQEAQGQTGTSRNKPGQGSQSRPKASESSQPGGKPDQAGGEGDREPPNGDPQVAPKEPGTPGGDSRGLPQGNGKESADQAIPQPPSPEKADDPNLEFARRATDLALDRLKDQLNKGEPDQELLDRLGWTRQDLESFVSRWEAMKRKANVKGRQAQAARTELDATLRSLGLHPRGAQIKNNLHDDQAHGLKEGRHTRPPAEYLDQYRAYTQGTSRGRPKDHEKAGSATNDRNK